MDALVCRNNLGRLLFIGVYGWVSDMWRNLVGDMCHNLIGGALRLFLQDNLIWPKCFDFQGDTLMHSIGLPISSLTRTGLLMSLLTRANV